MIFYGTDCLKSAGSMTTDPALLTIVASCLDPKSIFGLLSKLFNTEVLDRVASLTPIGHASGMTIYGHAWRRGLTGCVFTVKMFGLLHLSCMAVMCDT